MFLPAISQPNPGNQLVLLKTITERVETDRGHYYVWIQHDNLHHTYLWPGPLKYFIYKGIECHLECTLPPARYLTRLLPRSLPYSAQSSTPCCRWATEVIKPEWEWLWWGVGECWDFKHLCISTEERIGLDTINNLWRILRALQDILTRWYVENGVTAISCNIEQKGLKTKMYIYIIWGEPWF